MRWATMNDGCERYEYAPERNDTNATILAANLQPLLDTCSSLIRRSLQYQPRTLLPKLDSFKVSRSLQWCFVSEEDCSEEQSRLLQEWLRERTLIQQEYLVLQRLRSSLIQQNTEGVDDSTQILRSYGREMRDAQVAAVLRSQKILDGFEKQIWGVQEQIRQVQGKNRCLLIPIPEPVTTTATAAEAPEDGSTTAQSQRILKENRLLYGVILDLLPYVLPSEIDYEEASSLRRYI